MSGDSSGEKRMNSFEIASKPLYRIEDGLYQNDKKLMDPNEQAQLEKLIQKEQQRANAQPGPVAQQQQQQAPSPTKMADAGDVLDGPNHQLDGHYLPDNVEISQGTAHGG